MYEYGASPEQMHYVPHVPPGTPDVDNTWQKAWRAIKVPELPNPNPNSNPIPNPNPNPNPNPKVPELLALIESSTHSAFEDTSLMNK